MIITVANQKGGVGKSATSQALAAGLAAKKNRVLLIDMDAQCTTSNVLRADTSRPTLYDVMTGDTAPRDAVQDLGGGLHIIPSSERFALADRTFVKLNSERLLRKALDKISGDFDVVIIDTPPALGVLTINALVAADAAIITAQAAASSVQGILQLRGTLDDVREAANPNLRVLGILLTMYKPTRLMDDFVVPIEELAKELKTTIYKTRIRELIVIKEAEAAMKNIFDFDPNSNGAQDYSAFVNEVHAQIKRGKK